VGTKRPKSPRHVVTHHCYTRAQISKLTHQQKFHLEECHRMEEQTLLSLQIWCRGLLEKFLERNEHLITTKNAVTIDIKYAEWYNYLIMQILYEEIYKDFCNGVISIEHTSIV
jgi:hypothetical protein